MGSLSIRVVPRGPPPTKPPLSNPTETCPFPKTKPSSSTSTRPIRTATPSLILSHTETITSFSTSTHPPESSLSSRPRISSHPRITTRTTATRLRSKSQTETLRFPSTCSSTYPTSWKVGPTRPPPSNRTETCPFPKTKVSCSTSTRPIRTTPSPTLSLTATTIVPASGLFAFNSPPDFESPTDNNSDNRYEATVRVSDGNASVTLNLFVFVTDLVESGPNLAPAFHSDGNFSIPENQAFVFDFNATDPDGDPLTYSIAYGDDAHLFEIVPASGLFAFNSPPDFESPTDGNSDNRYEATVRVSDGNASVTLDVQVFVTDLVESGPNLAPAFHSDGNFSIPENQAFVFDFNATDPDGDPLTYSIAYGDDAHLFEIVPASGLFAFNSPPDFESPTDGNSDNRYEATVRVSDGNASVTLDVQVFVTDLVESGPNLAPAFHSDGNFSIPENQAFVFDFNATDPDGDPLTYSIAYGDDAHLFETFPPQRIRPGSALRGIQPSTSSRPPKDLFENTFPILRIRLQRDRPSSHLFHSDNLYEVTVRVLAFGIRKRLRSPRPGNSPLLRGYRSNASWEPSTSASGVNFVTDLVESGPNLAPAFHSDGSQLFHSRKPGLRIRLQRNRSGRRPPHLFHCLRRRRSPLRNRSRLRVACIQFSSRLRVTDRRQLGQPLRGYRPGFRRQRFGHPRRSSLRNRPRGKRAQSGSRLPLGRKPFHSRKPGLRIRLQRNRSGRRHPHLFLAYGDDAHLFEIVPASGLLAFNSPPDFESPTDGNSDNRYEATVRVSDGNASVTLDVQVFVTDLVESGPNLAPAFHSDGNFSIPENQAFVFDFNATDPDGDPLTYSIAYGDDAHLFEIVPASGLLAFNSPNRLRVARQTATRTTVTRLPSGFPTATPRSPSTFKFS